uniref:Hypothetical secreted peptide n=1 Tax=Glossina morsitans morsitans TaxID=37546 RepID=D3TSL5_GLOMM
MVIQYVFMLLKNLMRTRGHCLHSGPIKLFYTNQNFCHIYLYLEILIVRNSTFTHNLHACIC